MKTTLRQIKEIRPLEETWNKLVSKFGDNMNKEIDLRDILKSNGIRDTVLILDIITNEEDKKQIMLFNADVAELSLHFFEDKYPKDNRPRNAIKGIRDFVEGKITKEELEKLAEAAYYAPDYADVPASSAANAAALSAAALSSSAVYAANNSNHHAKWKEIEELLLKYI